MSTSTVPGNQMTGNAFLTQDMIFKRDATIPNKKDQSRPFRVIELLDPNTLDVVSLFVRDGAVINTTGIQFHDTVVASFGMEFLYGKPQMVLKGIDKQKSYFFRFEKVNVNKQ